MCANSTSCEKKFQVTIIRTYWFNWHTEINFKDIMKSYYMYLTFFLLELNVNYACGKSKCCSPRDQTKNLCIWTFKTICNSFFRLRQAPVFVLHLSSWYVKLYAGDSSVSTTLQPNGKIIPPLTTLFYHNDTWFFLTWIMSQ